MFCSNPFGVKACILRIFTKVVFFLLIVGATLTARAQQTAKVTASDIWYWEYLPPDYNSNSDDYPIIIFFHGLGERGNSEADLGKVRRNGPPKHINNGTEFPFIIISPQLKTNLGNWPPWYMDEVVETAKATLRVDENRIYVTGLSLGGGGAWFYAQSFPEKIAAVAPVCGSRNTRNKACDIAAENVPVWAFHGDADGVVSANLSINMVNAINACTPTPDPLALMTLYAGVGHNSWSRAYRTDNSLHTPNLYEWFLQYSKASVSANAGPDLEVTLPQTSVNITGSGISSGTISTYEWTQLTGSATTLTNSNTATLTVSGLAEGIYSFQLRVTDDMGASATDDVQVTVVAANQSPTANAGSDINLQLPTNSVTIFGSGSDNDGSISTYQWLQTSGNSATLTGQTTATLNVSGLTEGSYEFELTVTDDDGASDIDNVIITVNAAANIEPVANAGADQLLTLPTNSIVLNGSGSDSDGSIATYNWQKLSGPTATLTNADQPSLTLNDLIVGSYTFQLTVTDDDGAQHSDDVQVTVSAANQAPTVDAGSNQNITLPTSSTNLTASASDNDGLIASYSWSQVSGPVTGTITNNDQPTCTITGLTVSGTYTFSVEVTDDDGASSSDEVNVIVVDAPVNQNPTVDAGNDQFITLPVNSVVLMANANDPDGSISTYSWTKTSGGAATLSGQNTNTLIVSALLDGSYTFNVTVTDNDGGTASDQVSVVVAPEEVNESPVADAGPNRTLTLPINSTTLDGSATDNDGMVVSFEWSQISGPSVSLTDNTSEDLNLTGLVEGTYSFELTVTDDDGAIDTDIAQVTVNAANTPPTANAGPNIQLTLPVNSTTITGSGSDNDGTIASYFWDQIDGPSTATISGESSTTLNVSDLIDGLYKFRLTVTDDGGLIGRDVVNVRVNAASNVSPVANAGPDRSITLPVNSLNLMGNATDTDGAITTILWTKESGPAATLVNNSSLTLSVSGLVEGNYVFRLSVTDDGGASDFDEVSVTVNPAATNAPPTANAGPNRTITLPTNSVTLNGSGSDSDGSIAIYSWIKVTGPTANLANANTSTLSVSSMIEGNYTFRLTVTDDDGATDSDLVTVSVLPGTTNQAPVADAGADITITLPNNTVTIFGSGSDPDGSIQSYSWVQNSGPAATLTNVSTPTLSVSDLVEGSYIFELTVTDDDSAQSTDLVSVTVNAADVNQPPTANAGTDISLTLPTNSTTLSGSGSDIDGSITNYQWTKVSGPSVSISNPNTANVTISDLLAGTYTFRLRVTDDDGATADDQAIVTVFPEEVNTSPTVNAGNDQTIVLPTNSTSITGTASDTDGSIASVIWTLLSGGTATLANENTLTLTASDLEEGQYEFRLTATDDDGATNSDQVIVNVLPEDSNLPPSVNAGSDVSIKLPTNTITLTGSASDSDGTIASYLWSKASGPTAQLTNQDRATLEVSDLVQGTYNFRLIVTDDDGATAEDFVRVTVLPETINVPPSVNAGANKTLQLPDNSISITASTVDDGTIVEIAWTQQSGPAEGDISGENTATLQLDNLVEGSYIFRVTVVDDGSLSASDEVTIRVLEAEEVLPNQPPTVDAGEDLVIQLPDNEVGVSAFASDPDDIVSGFQWTQVLGPSSVTFDADTASSVVVGNLTAGRYVLEVRAFDVEGATASDDIQIVVLEADELARPRKLFSPNNDGVDDIWMVDNVENLSECELVIFNRQGDEVFRTIGYQNNWEGTDSKNNPLPDGVYYFVFRCQNQENTLSGSITLIR